VKEKRVAEVFYVSLARLGDQSGKEAKYRFRVLFLSFLEGIEQNLLIVFFLFFVK
jgi:hypothetical protein